MARIRLGAVVVAEGRLETELDGLRRALGDEGIGRVPPHVTLVPPVNVRHGDRASALGVLRAAAAATEPFTLGLGPARTFLPETPVVFLAVGGDERSGAADDATGRGADMIGALRDRVFRAPLARELTYDFVPHLTLVPDAAPDRIEAAVAALADYRATMAVRRLVLLQERMLDGGGRVWEPWADALLDAEAVVGRGGLELVLTGSTIVDPEAAAMVGAELDGHRLPDGWRRAPGRIVVTARRDREVVGVARATVGPDDARLDLLLVARAHRDEGVGSQLVARLLALVGRPVTARRPPGDRIGAFLAGRGWRLRGTLELADGRFDDLEAPFV
ncbi:MAG: GNAT family N-acetyltransferase [Actinomycetota bacterium]|nr:GNAT family N-acetyltransferase [Actinomycetota bacterium]